MSKLRPFKGPFIFLLHLLTLLVTSVAILSRHELFHSWWRGFNVAVHFQIGYLATVILFGSLYLALKRRRAAIVCGLISTMIFWPMLPFWAPNVRNPKLSPTQDAPAPPARKIILHNVLGTSTHYDEVFSYIEKEDPDAFLLVEGTNQWLKAIRPLLEDYPYEFNNPQYRGYGMIFMSKYPLSESQYLPDKKAAHPTLHTLIHFPEQTVSFVGVHPPSPLDRPDLQYTLENRHRKIQSIARNRGSLPLIVGGDFNDTPWSPTFRALVNGSGTRHAGHGHGLRLTWEPVDPDFPSLPFFGLPIDHILVTPEIYVHDYRIGPFLGSDHRAVLMEFSLVEDR